MRHFVCVLAFILAWGTSAWAEGLEQKIMQDALNNYIEPGYSKLAAAAHSLSTDIDTLCAKPNTAEIEHARASFKALSLRWAEIQWFRFGPILSDNRVDKILFFPDRKSTGLRQVQTALAKQDPSVVSLELLKKQSVALQGLGAIEFILFGTGSETLAEENAHRCGYARVASANLLEITSDVLHQWQNDQSLREGWTLTSDKASLFRDERDAMNTLLGTLIHGLEATRDTRINVFLREEPKRDRPKSAALWRSQLSLPEIKASLDGLYELYQASGFKQLVASKNPYLDNSIQFEFRQARETAASFEGPLEDLLADPKARARLEYLRVTIEQLIERFDSEFATAAGLAAGFSFGDGD